MRMLPQLLAVFTAALLLLLEEVQGAGAPCGPYKLAYYEHGLLYFRDEQGEAGGIDLDIATELARRSGCEFIGVLESRVRTWEQFRRNALDLTLSATYSAEREQWVDFVPYLKARSFVVTRASLAAGLPTAEAFIAARHLTVVVVKSFNYGADFNEWLERLRPQGRVVEASDFNVAARLFEFGRVDAILANPLSLPVLQRHGSATAIAGLRVLPWANSAVVTGSLAMSRVRVSEPDRQRMRLALGGMLRDGTVEAIVKRYVEVSVARTVLLDGKD